MKRPTFLPYAVGLLLVNAATVFAGQTTLTTYYPAPSGNYEQLRLVPRASLSGSACLPGTLYVENTNNTLQYCGNSSVWGNQSLVWNQTGSNIYPSDLAANVGIGLSNPAYKLDVSGNAHISGNATVDGNAIIPTISGSTTVTGNATVNGNAIIPTISGSTHITGDETVDGSVTAGGFFYTSDRRLKKDIRPLTHALDKVQRLNGVTFTWKKNDIKDVGVIAQNVESVLPELVSTGKDGMKSVEYGNLTAVLIEAVKEQQKEITDLKKEIAELKNKRPAH